MSERARIFLALAKIFPERQEDSYGPSKYLVNSFPSRKIFNTRDKPDKNKNDGGSLTVKFRLASPRADNCDNLLKLMIVVNASKLREQKDLTCIFDFVPRHL